MYTYAELVDMLLMYGECMQNAHRAAAEYRRRFPNRQSPNPRTFVRTVQRLRDTGSLAVVHRDRGAPDNINVVENVLNMVEEEPRVSTRTIAQRQGISQSKAWRILRENSLHPYHFQKVQALDVNDFPARREFCTWLQAQITQNPEFLRNVLWTDECCFTRSGILNT